MHCYVYVEIYIFSTCIGSDVRHVGPNMLYFVDLNQLIRLR